MITVEQIEELVAEKLVDTDKFIVGIKVSPAKKIIVLLDGFTGIGIEDCIQISRHIENSLDREVDDFELEVSSPGLESAFAVPQQYQKAEGKQVEIYTEKGTKYLGVLSKVSEESVVVSYEENKKLEGAKKKTLVKGEIELFFNTSEPELKIKSTKRVISFKY